MKNAKCCDKLRRSLELDEARRWMEEHILGEGDLLLYGRLSEEMYSISPVVIWKELRAVAEKYLTCGADRTGIFHRIVDETIEALTERDNLDKADGSCAIWPARPLVCRVHLAERTDEYCMPHNGQENPKAYGINYIELSYILSAIFTIHRDSIKKTMGRLLLELKDWSGTPMHSR